MKKNIVALLVGIAVVATIATGCGSQEVVETAGKGHFVATTAHTRDGKVEGYNPDMVAEVVEDAEEVLETEEVIEAAAEGIEVAEEKLNNEVAVKAQGQAEVESDAAVSLDATDKAASNDELAAAKAEARAEEEVKTDTTVKAETTVKANSTKATAQTEAKADAKAEVKAETVSTDGKSYTSSAFVDFLNQKRAELGLNPVSYASDLEAAAMQRAKDIVNNFSHDGWNNTGSDMENIMIGSTNSVSDWYAAWSGSPEHYQNMVAPDLGSAVLGIYELNGEYYLVMLGHAAIPETIENLVNPETTNKDEALEAAVESGDMVQSGETTTFEDGSSVTAYVNAESYTTVEEVCAETGETPEQIADDINAALAEMGIELPEGGYHF